MPTPKRTTYIPLFLLNKDRYYYLQINTQGITLYAQGETEALYRLQESILLANASANNRDTIHLAVLKGNGELCYILIPPSGTPQTTVLTKLDVRTTKYRSLILLPRGEMVHIFYAYAHHSIPELWYVEHRLWTGKTWQSMRLGEIVHPRSPLYQIAVDNQGNIHYAGLTFQGRQSLLIQNRFHGVFHLWGNPTQTLTLSKEIIDMASLLTPDNTHHLFLAAKTQNNYEILWAKRLNSADLLEQWQLIPTPITTVGGPWGSIGSIEASGSLWLLVKANEEHLLHYQGNHWQQTSSQTLHQPLQFIRSDEHYYQAAWLADSIDPSLPLFNQELGLRLKRPKPVHKVSGTASTLGYVRPNTPSPNEIAQTQPVTAQPPAPQGSLNAEIFEMFPAEKAIVSAQAPGTPEWPSDTGAQDLATTPIASESPTAPFSAESSPPWLLKDSLQPLLEPLVERLVSLENALEAISNQIANLTDENLRLPELQAKQETFIHSLLETQREALESVTSQFKAEFEKLSSVYHLEIDTLRKEQALGLRALENAINNHEEKGFWSRWKK